MKTILFILLFSVTGFAEESPAPSSAPTSAVESNRNHYVICRNDKVVRTIRVEIKNGICRAIYSKEGQEDVVAKSGANEKCYEVVGQIRGNLEKSVWKCKDVEPDRISFTVE